ncbi:MAG: HAD family hydrolase [Deltaproteobacteria bacterium]|nr:HAD family hydrolase [Deltaproteobacteria bacterium]
MKGVLFDFDGTLTKPGAIDFRAIRRGIGCPHDIAILEYIKLQSPENRTLLTEMLEGHEANAARSSVPNAGAEACLSSLKKRAIPIGIITRNSLKSVVVALKQFEGIKCHDFDALITRETAPPKPSPEGVFKAAEYMGCFAQELMVVGDFRFDIIAGKRAGALTLLLTNGGESTMAPEDPKPDFVCGHLDDVVEIVLEKVTLPRPGGPVREK